MLASAGVRSPIVRFLVLLLPGTIAWPALTARAAAAGPSEATLADEARAPAAAGAPITAELDVQAPPGCATRDQLVARVLARSPRIHFVEAGRAATALRASINPGPTGSIASELVVAPADGRQSTRRLTASTCTEAIDALALVIAITLDPTYVTAPPAPEASTEPAPPPAAPKAEPAPEPAQRPNDRRPVAPSAAEPEPEQGPATPHLGGGATAGAWIGPAPRAMAAFGGYASFALDRSSIWSLGIVLSGSHAFANGLVESGGVADLTLDTLTLDACPLLLRVAVLEARGCASGLAGRLTATGTETYSGMSYTRPFAAVGGAVRLSAVVARYLVLSGRFGAAASLIRDAFEFSPEVFHRVASVTLEMELGLGLRFP
jgi:hypothetical protein